MLRVKPIFNGVQISNFICHESLLFCSSSSEQPVHFMVDYLVDSLGFSREEAVAASNKVSHLKFPETSDSVINFFKEIGLKQSQIKNIVSYDAHFLALRDINKTLIPKIRVFQDLGLSDSELAHLLACNPSVLIRSLEIHIKPLIECLRSILGSDENVAKAIKRNFLLVNYNVKRILPNASLLRSYGLSEERLRKLFMYNPWHLFCQTEILEENLRGVETKLGIPRNSQMFIHGIHVYSTISSVTMESKFQVFKSYGWTEDDISTMVRKLPSCVKLSEAKIRTGLDFFMKELSFKPDYLSRVPSLLNYSLENRILPRRELWEALMEKKLLKTNRSLYAIMSIFDKRFLNDYVIRFKDDLPELCDAYIKKRSSSSKAIVE